MRAAMKEDVCRMPNTTRTDWDPRAEAVTRDQAAAYDWMREHCPVAYSEFLGWSVFRHEDLLRVLHDPNTFSNAASRHLSVPNGLDPPEHTAYRRAIDRYFSPDRMAAFEPVCRRIVADLVGLLAARDRVELTGDFAEPFAARAQCAFLGWPAEMEKPLRLWTRKNHAATFAQDREAMAAVARAFAEHVGELLRERRDIGVGPDHDLTADLMHQRIQGQPPRDEQIVSILRNWTVGEVGTLSAAVGILVRFLAAHPDLQQQLRDHPSLLSSATEEILRIHGPLVANRRVATRPVKIRGRRIETGEQLSLIWIAANRDGRVFRDPLSFRWDRDHSQNLLYGAGIHDCPGAPLARLEMCVVLEELLGATNGIELIPDEPPSRAVYPSAGFTALPVRIHWSHR